MEGISPSETNTARDQDKFIEDNPIASRAAAALQGIPLIGSYTDEMVGLVSEDAAEAMRYSANVRVPSFHNRSCHNLSYSLAFLFKPLYIMCLVCIKPSSRIFYWGSWCSPTKPFYKSSGSTR